MSSKIKSSGKEQVVSKLGRKKRLQTLIKTRKKNPRKTIARHFMIVSNEHVEFFQISNVI